MASPQRTLAALSDAVKDRMTLLPNPTVGSTIKPTQTPTQIVLSGFGGRTLADPLYAGMQLTISVSTGFAGVAVTAASAINAAGNTQISLTDDGDAIILRSIQIGSNLRWRIIANMGADLS